AQIFISLYGCQRAFMDDVSHVNGVQAATCTSGSALSYDRFGTAFTGKDGGNISFRLAPVDYGFFDLFSVQPLAGRLLEQQRGEDDLLRDKPGNPANPSIVINETA